MKSVYNIKHLVYTVASSIVNVISSQGVAASVGYNISHNVSDCYTQEVPVRNILQN